VLPIFLFSFSDSGSRTQPTSTQKLVNDAGRGMPLVSKRVNEEERGPGRHQGG